MVKIEPMLLTETWDKSQLKDETKLFQIKENGVRAIVHIKKSKVVGIRNRSNNPILYCFPELKELEFPFNEAILDCEICVFQDERSIFYGGIDKRRSVPTEEILQKYPATMVVFDVLKFEEDVLVFSPYNHRYEKIKTIPGENNSKLKIAKNYCNGEELWQKVKSKNLEGVVIKSPNTPYELGKRSKNYVKMKNYKLAEVIVYDTEENTRGTKIFGETVIDEETIKVECQLGGVFGVESGTTHIIKYLDIYGSRMIQPTKVKREQIWGLKI